jgi:hypothetical protein
MIETGRGNVWIIVATITRNEIFENNDGIIMITSTPNVYANYIHHQKSNGILFEDNF